MRPPQEPEGAGEAEMIAAESALGRREYRAAQAHLAAAERRGAAPEEVERLRNAAAAAAQGEARRARTAPWAGFGIAAAGYLALTIQQPLGWSLPVWAVLAFLVIPGISGAVAGRWQGFDQDASRRFWVGGRAGAGAMALYCGLSLIVVRQRFSSGAEAGQTVLAGLFVVLVYAALAGVVAGLAGALPGRAVKPERRG